MSIILFSTFEQRIAFTTFHAYLNSCSMGRCDRVAMVYIAQNNFLTIEPPKQIGPVLSCRYIHQKYRIKLHLNPLFVRLNFLFVARSRIVVQSDRIHAVFFSHLNDYPVYCFHLYNQQQKKYLSAYVFSGKGKSSDWSLSMRLRFFMNSLLLLLAIVHHFFVKNNATKQTLETITVLRK